MNTEAIKQRAIQKFKTPEGKIVDILFAISSGELFFKEEDARSAAAKLVDQTITPYYRDGEVRELAKKLPLLNDMVIATDFIKTCKWSKVKPSYADYEKHVNQINQRPISEEIFSFVQSKVYSSNKPVVVGLMDQIYMYDKGIVNAYFLRRFAQGQLWQYDHFLVFTCPTNTELMRGDYYVMFSDILGPR